MLEKPLFSCGKACVIVLRVVTLVILTYKDIKLEFKRVLVVGSRKGWAENPEDFK